MIFSGALRAGQALRQEEIARQLGISRLPIREALNRLATEGLVELKPRRGFTSPRSMPTRSTTSSTCAHCSRPRGISRHRRTPADADAMTDRGRTRSVVRRGRLRPVSEIERPLSRTAISELWAQHLWRQIAAARQGRPPDSRPRPRDRRAATRPKRASPAGEARSGRERARHPSPSFVASIVHTQRAR